MAFGDQFNVMKSLQAVDTWIAAINDNMQGSAKAGYRARRVTFEGSGEPMIHREAVANLLNVQRPDQVLNVNRLTTDFSQGEITASYDAVHMAISDAGDPNGPGFFYVTETIDANGLATGNGLLTRDGEFHWDSNGNLRTKQGYYVIQPVTAAAGPIVDGYVYNQARIAANDMDGTAGPTGLGLATGDFSLAYDGTETHWLVDGIDTNVWVGLVKPLQYQPLLPGLAKDLQTDLTPLPDDATVFLYGGISWDGGAFSGDFSTQVQVFGNSLEGANTSMSELVPELSLAQKMYQSLAKILQAYQTNLDNAFSIIR